MDDLSSVLERFNRKERNLLIRDALGHQHAPLHLNVSFRNRLEKALGLSLGAIPQNAWWATDYHVSWLAGAVAVFAKGDGALNGDHHNLCRPRTNGEGQRWLVERNQEDIDLLIAWGNNLLFVEAKGYGNFGNEQISSKLDRLNIFYDFYTSLNVPMERRITFYFQLISPSEPQKLRCEWPAWATQGSVTPWLELQRPAPSNVLKVSGDKGSSWRILRQKFNRKELLEKGGGD